MPKTLYNQTLDPCRPLPGLAEHILKVQWRWKLQKVCRTAGLCSELSSCDTRCTPAVEEEDYEVMYSIDGIREQVLEIEYRAKKVWFGSEVILLVCGTCLLIELPADHRAGGGGATQSVCYCCAVARWPYSRPHNLKEGW